MAWHDGFTHEELSMVVSEVAAGGGFCCDGHRLERETVTGSRKKRERLARQAIGWGCLDGVPNGRDHLRNRAYMDRLLATI